MRLVPGYRNHFPAHAAVLIAGPDCSSGSRIHVNVYRALPSCREDVLTTSTTFLHLSELHLVPPGRLVEGVDPMRQLRSVLARIERLEEAPAFIVVSGDLTEDGSAEGYEVVNAVLTELGGGVPPVLLALGNHDDRATFRRVVLGDERADALA